MTATQKAVDELVLMDEFQEYAKAQQDAAKPINHTESKSVAGAAQSNVSNANRGVTAGTQGAGQQADVTGRASDNPVPASPKPQQYRNSAATTLTNANQVNVKLGGDASKAAPHCSGRSRRMRQRLRTYEPAHGESTRAYTAK